MAGEEESGTSMFSFSFFVYSFLLNPVLSRVVSWRKRQYSLTRRLGHAWLLLLVIALAFAAVEIYSDWDINYFKVLGVGRDCSVSQLKRAYKDLALEKHPDKNPGPDAEAEFVIIQEAYNTLLNENAREVYDKFGMSGLKALQESSSSDATYVINSMNLMTEVIVFYVIWTFITYILTLQSAHTNARAYTYAGLGVICAIDIGMRYSDLNLPLFFLPYMTTKEKVKLLQMLYPPLIHGVNTIQMMIFVDLDKATMHVVQQMMQQNRDIWIKLRAIEAKVESATRRGGKGSGSGAAAAGAGAGLGAGAEARGDKAANKNESSEKGAPQPKGGVSTTEMPDCDLKPAPKFKIPGWVYFIVFTSIFQYMNS